MLNVFDKAENTYEVPLTTEDFEQKPNVPEGDRIFRLVKAEFKTSKAGNEMFVWKLADEETGTEVDYYTVTTKGKNFSFVQMLRSLEVTPAVHPELFVDGKLILNTDALVGSRVLCSVTHNKVLRQTSADKEEYQLTEEDYMLFPKINKTAPPPSSIVVN